MPRHYVRKTNRGANLEDLKRARDRVREGCSIRAAAKDFNIARMTLKRFIEKSNDQQNQIFGYKNCQIKNMIFSSEMETELADHIKTLAEQFHGLTRNKCRALIVEYAVRNEVKIPDSWQNNGMTGEHFWISFKERNRLSIRTPEATSIGRATAFNRYTVGKFFENLGSVMQMYKFEAQDIYNVDETGCTTVQVPENVVAELGAKQVGSVTSGERGQLVTAAYAVNAVGSVVPPMLIFPRKNYKDFFIKGGPASCIGGANPSGWMNEELFITYLKHFISYTRCNKEKKVLLILDNLEAHQTLAAIDLAKENGVILLTIPPKTSHKLQPLDVSCYKPFKTSYNRAMDNWMRSNPGKTVTIYDIPELIAHAHLNGLTAQNIVSGFRSTGIFPLNQDVFSETEYAPSCVTNRDLPVPLSAEIAPDINPNESVDSIDEAANSSTSCENVDQPADANLELSNSTHSCSNFAASSSQGAEPRRIHASPADIVPLPKAGPRKTSRKGKKRSETRILTNTPVRNSIAVATAARKKKKEKVAQKPKKALFQARERKEKTPTSSEESDVVMEFADSSDADIISEHEEYMEGDFVVVKLCSAKSRIVHYIARIDTIENNECEGVFLKRENSLVHGTSVFVINKNDEASFSEDDIIMKLPAPHQIGGTVRREEKLTFSCDFSRWDFFTSFY